MTRDYSLPKFLPPSWKEREATAVAESEQAFAAAVVSIRGRRQVEHSRACRALAGDLDGCDGRCLPFVNRWAS